MEKKKNVKQVSVYLDKDVFDKVVEQATILRRSKTFIINELLKQKFRL
jgi:predicted transcriptional regulator